MCETLRYKLGYVNKQWTFSLIIVIWFSFNWPNYVIWTFYAEWEALYNYRQCLSALMMFLFNMCCNNSHLTKTQCIKVTLTLNSIAAK